MKEKWLIDMCTDKVKTVFFGNNSELLLTLISKSSVHSIFCRNSENESIAKIKKIARLNNIPILMPSKKELYSYISYLKNMNVDFYLVCGYKYILPREIFEIPSLGTINIHPSLLPAYRGQHVINWAIINGEEKTGVTFHLIDEGIDTGDILFQKEILIDSDDTAFSLHQKVYRAASGILCCMLEYISSNHELKPLKQEVGEATYFSPRKPEDGKIDWNKSGIEVCNLVKGLVKPWPGAYSLLDGQKICLWKCYFKQKDLKCSNGQIVCIKDEILFIKVKDGIIICDDYSLYNNNGDVVNSNIRPGGLLK